MRHIKGVGRVRRSKSQCVHVTLSVRDSIDYTDETVTRGLDGMIQILTVHGKTCINHVVVLSEICE